MPITNDIRARADEALEQGRKVVDQAFETAQTQLADITEQANQFVGKLAGTAKGYAGAVSDRAEELLATARKDERIARLLDSAEAVTGTVVETVQQHVVKPVQKLTGVGVTPAHTPSEPATVSTVTPTTLPAEGPTVTPLAEPATSTETTAPKAPLTDA
jgi:ABC-type transporter Mla subunit MlaD